MKIRRNLLIFKLNYFFLMCWPLSALAIVYFQSITNSYSLAFAVFSIATLTQTISEIPTGIISDKVGRKMSMVLSALFILLSFLLFAIAGNYHSVFLLFLGGFLWGVSDSFLSGTDEALIFDTMKQMKKKHKYDIVFAKSRIFHQLGGATSSLIAIGVLYFYSLHVLAWISVLPALAQFVSSLFFIEPQINSQKNINSFNHLKAAWKNIKNNKKLQKLALANCLNKAISMTSYRLEGVYFNNLIASWMVNIAILIRQVLGAISYAVSPFFRKIGFFNMIIFSTLGNVILRAIGLMINNVASPFVMILQNLFIGTATTAESALLQKEFSDNQRATMGSIISLFGGIIMALSYYVFGIVADFWNIHIAIALLIVIKLLIGIYYYSLFKKYEK